MRTWKVRARLRNQGGAGGEQRAPEAQPSFRQALLLAADARALADHGRGEGSRGMHLEGELESSRPQRRDRGHAVLAADQAGAAGVPVGRVADGEPVAARSRELDEDARCGEAEHAGRSGPVRIGRGCGTSSTVRFAVRRTGTKAERPLRRSARLAAGAVVRRRVREHDVAHAQPAQPRQVGARAERCRRAPRSAGSRPGGTSRAQAGSRPRRGRRRASGLQCRRPRRGTRGSRCARRKRDRGRPVGGARRRVARLREARRRAASGSTRRARRERRGTPAAAASAAARARVPRSGSAA